MWLSRWCRYMISAIDNKSPWNDLFLACRTALRTPQGLGVAEFIIPLLVLDFLCFADVHEQETAVQEMISVLNDVERENGAFHMSHIERRKAVNVVFMIIDTLEFWAEQVVEDRYRKIKSKRTFDAEKKGLSDDSCFKIEEEISEKIPLILRANAAADVGMHARALRLLEMAGRKKVADQIYNVVDDGDKSGALWNKPEKKTVQRDIIVKGHDLKVMKNILVKLNDWETLAALDENNLSADPLERTLDSIRTSEASGDWDKALRDYERAQQLNYSSGEDSQIQRGLLNCLLELGQFESVLKQVKGITHPVNGTQLDSTYAKPYAIEAAWRLGRWDTLDDLLNSRELRSEQCSSLDSEGTYQTFKGDAMLRLKGKSPDAVSKAIGTSRQAVMDRLAIVAREGYTRAYPLVVQLQSLREIEDATPFLCEIEEDRSTSFTALTNSDSLDGLSWERRLQVLSSSGASRLIHTRLALARLAGDASLEVSLFLEVGRKARKNGLFNIAADSFAQAEAGFQKILPTEGTEGGKHRVEDFKEKVRLELAKLTHGCGQSGIALKMLGDDHIQSLIQLSDTKAKTKSILSRERSVLVSKSDLSDDDIIKRYTERALQSTQWMVEGGLKGGAEIKARFQLICEVAPNLEKAHFQFAKYLDSTLALRSRPQHLPHTSFDEDKLHTETIRHDRACQDNIVLAIKHYATALTMSKKHVHVFNALPRLLTLWCDFTAISPPEEASEQTPSSKSKTKKSARKARSNSISATEKSICKTYLRNARFLPFYFYFSFNLFSHFLNSSIGEKAA